MWVDGRRRVTRVADRPEVGQGMRADDRREASPGTRVDGHQAVSRRVMPEAGRRAVMAMQVDVRRVAMAVAVRKVAAADLRVEGKTAGAEVTGHRISAANRSNGTGGQGPRASGQDKAPRLA